MNEKFVIPNDSLQKIDKVKRILNTNDKSRALNYCINLAEKLATQLDRGGSVYYETRKGKSFEILLPGES